MKPQEIPRSRLPLLCWTAWGLPTLALMLFTVGAASTPRVAYAQEGEGAPSREKSSAEKGRKRRSGRSVHKEAEGTKAADRFEADTVIKSQYRYDGEPLEVDPD